MKRILTALVLIPTIAYVVLAANVWVFLGVLVTVACLCYREYNDIAAATKLSLDNVKTRLSRARAMLRRKLEHYYRDL